MPRKKETIIDFLDSKGLYIGIIPDADGEVWLVELCGIPLMETGSSRAEAEQIGIAEAMRIFCEWEKG